MVLLCTIVMKKKKKKGNNVVNRCDNAIGLKDESLSLPSAAKELSVTYLKNDISLQWQYSSESVWCLAVYSFPASSASPLLLLIFLPFFLCPLKNNSAAT